MLLVAIPSQKRQELSKHYRETVIRRLSACYVVEYNPTDKTVRRGATLDRSV